MKPIRVEFLMSGNLSEGIENLNTLCERLVNNIDCVDDLIESTFNDRKNTRLSDILNDTIFSFQNALNAGSTVDNFHSSNGIISLDELIKLVEHDVSQLKNSTESILLYQKEYQLSVLLLQKIAKNKDNYPNLNAFVNDYNKAFNLMLQKRERFDYYKAVLNPETQIEISKGFFDNLISFINQQTVKLSFGIEKKLLGIKSKYEKTLNYIASLEKELRTSQSGYLTDEQDLKLLEARELAFNNFYNDVLAVYESERQSMRDFLKEYGNYHERKAAIAEEYAEKIRKAQSEGERLRLQKELEESQRAERSAINEYLLLYGSYQQKKLALQEEYAEKISKSKNAGERLSLERELEEKLSGLEMSEFEKSINWDAVFNGLDKLSLEHLKKLKEQLKEALNAKEITAENAAIISERINTINGKIQRKSKEWQSAFGLLIPELEEIRRLERESEEAQERLAQAEKRQAEALKEVEATRREILELLKQEGIEAEESQITATGQDAFIGQLQGQGKDVTKLTGLFSKLGKQERNVTESTEALSQAEGEAGKAAEAAGGSFASTVAIIDAIVHGINDNVQSAKDLFEQMDLADTKFGKGWSAFAESSQYATDAWESLKSGNIMGVANGVYGSLRTLGNALGEWGVGGFGDSDTRLLEDIERLTQSNKSLEQAIDNLADELGDARMSDVDALYEQQKENIRKVEAQTQEMMSRTGAAYSNGFLGIGGRQSSNSKINDGMSSAEWDAISKLLGKNVRSAADFWSLSSKEMYEVATKLTSEYSHLKDLANDGYKDASEFMDEYITYWKELEEIENAYREKMTGLSFDSARSSFVSLVKDVKNGTKEMLSSVDEMFEDAVLNWLMSERYSERIQAWYEKFAEYMKDGLEAWEADELRTWYGSIFDDMNSERDAAYSAAGIDPASEGTTQSGKAGSFETMTQDQGTKLEGLFTSGQMHWASMDELLGKIADRWGGLLDRLGELIDNTSYCRHLADIADDIKVMRRDGVKMR